MVWFASLSQYLEVKSPNGLTLLTTSVFSPSVSVLAYKYISPVSTYCSLEVFELGTAKTKSKTFPVLSPRITPIEMVSVFTRITGQPACHDPDTADTFGEMTAPLVGPAFKEDAKQMMEWSAVTPAEKICFGAMDPEEDDSYELLGVRASTFEDFLLRSGWKGPD
jgi:hypothetical protein